MDEEEEKEKKRKRHQKPKKPLLPRPVIPEKKDGVLKPGNSAPGFQASGPTCVTDGWMGDGSQKCSSISLKICSDEV